MNAYCEPSIHLIFTTIQWKGHYHHDFHVATEVQRLSNLFKVTRLRWKLHTLVPQFVFLTSWCTDSHKTHTLWTFKPLKCSVSTLPPTMEDHAVLSSWTSFANHLITKWKKEMHPYLRAYDIHFFFNFLGKSVVNSVPCGYNHTFCHPSPTLPAPWCNLYSLSWSIPLIAPLSPKCSALSLESLFQFK